MTLSEIRKVALALVTANITADEDAADQILRDFPQADLPALAGTLVAYLGNVVGLSARMMSDDGQPITALEWWEIVLRAERNLGINQEKG